MRLFLFAPLAFAAGFIPLSFAPCAQGKVIATYTYRKAPKAKQKSITLEDLKYNYGIVRQNTFTPPNPQVFFNDFFRFKMGVEAALHDKKMVRNPNILDMIASRPLRSHFEQEIYKLFAESQLDKRMRALDKKSNELPEATLRKLYGKQPEFNYFYISIQFPVNPSPGQIKEAFNRAKKVHRQVARSKKPFPELVVLYSDDKAGGSVSLNRSKGFILPEVFARLKTMKNGQISPPIRVMNGYRIVKLNRRIPLQEANLTAVKLDYFNEERVKMFNAYFDGLKKHFKTAIVNRKLINSIK